ncbi:MAG: hypothetical protein H6R47_1283, partial [Proteobacteria bacterium]|nr:hypothetical protein [Pseudomonadota bacterium]
MTSDAAQARVGLGMSLRCNSI